MIDQISFQTVLDALLDENQVFPAGYLYNFSDLETYQLRELAMVWPKVHPIRKQSLLEDLEELASRDTLLSFDKLAISLLADADPEVRILAIRLLWECENPKLIPIFLEILRNDPSDSAKAAASAGLGPFVYMGELEKLPSSTLKLIEDELIRVASLEENGIVQRMAIESLGFSSRKEVNSIISSAYSSNDHDWVASSLVAMGRSSDPAWEEEVLAGIEHSSDLIRLEAIQAAGHLNLESSRTILLEQLDNLDDLEICKATLWSLSQIGGEGVRERIEEIQADFDPEEEHFLDEVLEDLNFTEEMASFTLLDLDAASGWDEEGDLFD